MISRGSRATIHKIIAVGLCLSLLCMSGFAPGRVVAQEGWHQDDRQDVLLYDVANPTEGTILPGYGAASVAFAPDGQTLAVGYADGTTHLWDGSTQREIATLQGYTDDVLSIAFSPDGQTLAVARGDGIDLWEVASLTPITTLEGHTDIVLSVAFSPDGQTLASASTDGTIRLWRCDQ